MTKRTVFIVIAAFIALDIVLFGAAWWIVLRSNTPDFEGERALHLPYGTDLAAATDSLTARGLLDSRVTFLLVARTTGWGDQIKAGHYTFEAGQSNVDLLEKLRAGLQTPVAVMIPPGSRPHRVARSAARNMAFGPDDFLRALRSVELAAELQTDTVHLFSYMLPETYHFFWLTEAEDVVRRIKREFDEFYARELAEPASEHEMTERKLLNLAAIVQWETNLDGEKARIAGVYLNRLRRGWPLQADPTVQYALIELEGGMRRLLYRDYRLDHPYNTYRFKGLPPGPITNPAPSTLRATANGESHDYMFFVAKPDGGHAFNVSLRAHNRDAAKLHQYLRQRRREQAAASAAQS